MCIRDRNRIFTQDAQRRAVRRDAIETQVFGRHRHDDRLALRARETARTAHEDVVVLHEGSKVLGSLRVRPEDVGHEADLGAILGVDLAEVVGQFGLGRLAEARGPKAVSYTHLDVYKRQGWLARTESGAPVSPEAVSGTCRA